MHILTHFWCLQPNSYDETLAEQCGILYYWNGNIYYRYDTAILVLQCIQQEYSTLKHDRQIDKQTDGWIKQWQRNDASVEHWVIKVQVDFECPSKEAHKSYIINMFVKICSLLVDNNRLHSLGKLLLCGTNRVSEPFKDH